MGWFYCCKAKLVIQSLRYPANSKKDRISVFDVGSGRTGYKLDIKDFLSVVIYLFIGVKRDSKTCGSRERELNLGGRYSIGQKIEALYSVMLRACKQRTTKEEIIHILEDRT